MERSAGILLPIFSLPSEYGIGSLGREARAFLELLHRSGQRWWQILPVGPAGGGNSPYSSSSTFAGNPLFVDLELLTEDGLLTAEDLLAAKTPPSNEIDYEAVSRSRESLLRKAFGVGALRDAEAVEAFTKRNSWVENYALYRAAKAHFDEKCWLDWPDAALRRHEDSAITRWRIELAEEVAYHTYVQFLFDRQWQALKAFANGLGVGILGDLPIYVSLDSADVWAEREQFQLDEEGHPTAVAGVPPDYFCADGQLWGNPLYDWAAMGRDGYGWWIRRVEGASRRFDAIRIDHFRGFASYWAVPAGAETAREGAWRKGPGMALVGVLTSWFAGIRFIAEDLGLAAPEVQELLKESGLPGMRVLEFAFSGPDNLYLPHHYERNCICYTGTHDNDTVLGWYAAANDKEKSFARDYLGAADGEAVRRALVHSGMASVADLFVAQLQDYLALGSESRINIPGQAEGNWNWRLRPGQLPEGLAEELHALTAATSRCAPPAED